MKFIIAIIILVFIYQSWNRVDAAELNEKHGSEVIMYTTSWCGFCKKARQLLSNHGVTYKEFDIEKSSQANAEMKGLGGQGVPVFVINGEVVKGFNKSRVEQLISQL